ncbi:PREDICTED: exocyst complex component EXO70A1-like [Camelina sativa]|uniref:Exocyst subunit Exo70 family protein n=1 Tax=Camelina sativa TaxID=90675 RepID=A0ABM0X9A9_CAMSA|nr:PREDICTED: exocyst complex component EXO70A1-like [Camelina sativa]
MSHVLHKSDLHELIVLEDKHNDESIKVDDGGKGNAHFIDEHHLVLHKDGKVDDRTTIYDPFKFKEILENYSKPIEPDHLFECLPSNLRPSPDGEGSGLEKANYSVPTSIPPMVLPLLHGLAQQMVKAGHQQQLIKTYRDTRRAVLEQSLQKLGVERFSKDEVHKMKWDILGAKIKNWIHYMRISVKLLFAMEKKNCNQIMDGVEPLRDQSFAEITTVSFDMLLSFGYAIAISRSPDKQFVMIDMYEIMREFQSEFELLFASKPCTEMKEDALNLTKLLAQTVQETIADFEDAVEMDTTETAVIDGSVHPLTSYVVTYVKYLFDYKSTLRLIFQEFDSANDPDTELRSAIRGIMRALRNNLDGKSRQYEEAALTQLFLMNNMYYIVRNFKRTEEARNWLGDDWVQTYGRIVQQHAQRYQTISCNKLLQCITVQSSDSSSIEDENITKTLVEDKFNTFNSQFEELHQRQCQWIVPDIELRESLRLAIAEILLPPYKSFLKLNGPIIEDGKNPQKYIRFTPEDLEQKLNDFFEGQNLD